MQNLKKEKGITLIALAVTVAVLILISFPIVVNVTNVTDLAAYSKFKDDIDNLRENISVAFHDDDISLIGPEYKGTLDFLELEQNGKPVKNENDNDVYYAINIDEVNKRLPIDMRSLNYGIGNSQIGVGNIYFGTNDVYIINQASRTIYYVEGIEYKSKVFYRLPEDLSNVEVGIKPGEIIKDFNKVYTDINGDKAKIPVGFKVSENEDEQIVSKGLVIIDEKGNEFVWIPVNSLKNENGNLLDIKYDRYMYGNQIDGGLDDVYKCTKIYNNKDDKYFFYETDKNSEELSVLENKGFYIARYEAGSNEARTESSDNVAPVVKKGVNVYNYIKRNDAKNLAENFLNNENVSSRLCTSQAWDTALKFLEQTGNASYLTDSSLGNYSGSLQLTGNTTAVNNIFDLGGNVNEWTTELYSDDSSQFTVRGGSAENTSSGNPVASRIPTGDIKSDNIGFRIVLFLSANASNVPLDEINVGDVVNYTPDTDTSSFSLTTAMSGYTTDQNIKRETYTWKVLNKNGNGSVDIMGVPTASMMIVNFMGATGYNNSVYYLNEICNQLYSNNALGTTARSINLDDIENKMNEAGKTARNDYVESGSSTKYGATKNYSGANAWYPNLAKYENVLGIDDEPVKTNGIGKSHNGTDLTENGITIPLLENDTSSKLKANSITVKQTCYYFGLSNEYFYDEDFYNLFFEIESYYWLASRYTSCLDNYATFGLFRVQNKIIFGDNMYRSSDSFGGNYNNRVAPVVRLGNKIKWTQEDNGSWNLAK